MIQNLFLVLAILLFILSFYLNKKEGFYNPMKDHEITDGMESHRYDGDLYQAESLLYELINKTKNKYVNAALGELLNILQYI